MRRDGVDIGKGRGIGRGKKRLTAVVQKMGIFTFTFTFTFTCFTISHSLAEELKYQPNGPLNIRNQMPLYIFFMAPYPDKADTLKKGKIKIDTSYHVSNNIIEQHPIWPCQTFDPQGDDLKYREWYVAIYTEVNRFDINLSYGILDRLEATVDIPYYIFSDGYLDGFIEQFEKTFSFIKTPNARRERPRYAYEYEVDNRGKPIIFSSSRPNDFGEVSTYLKYKVLSQEGYLPAMSLRAAVKFPTSKDELLGSRKLDYAVGLLLDKDLIDRFFLYFNLNWVFVERPNIMNNLQVFKEDMIHGVLGLEYFFTKKTSAIFQATANTTLYDAGIPCTGNDPVVLTIGFNHNFNESISWQIAIDENTNSGAPDFGLFTNLKVRI
jgi:hypothetical protein